MQLCGVRSTSLIRCDLEWNVLLLINKVPFDHSFNDIILCKTEKAILKKFNYEY